MGLLLDEHLQRINAAKNVLAGLVNAVAAVVFISVTDVAWEAAGLIAVGSVVGGQVGADIGRRIAPAVLRGLVVAGRHRRDRRRSSSTERMAEPYVGSTTAERPRAGATTSV